MLTIISILIFTFILFLILLFGKRYYDGIGLTKIEEEEEEEENKEDDTKPNFYDTDNRDSYFSDEVVDCQETIAGYEECVTVGQDLVTVSQYPMNGGKACTEKLCRNTDVYDCRAHGKERGVFIQRKTDNKFLNIEIKPCADGSSFVLEDGYVFDPPISQEEIDEMTCKDTDIQRITVKNSEGKDISWDVILKWEDYNVSGFATTWILRIKPIDNSGKDSFDLYTHLRDSSYGIDKTIYLVPAHGNRQLNHLQIKLSYNESAFHEHSQNSDGVNLVCTEDNSQMVRYEPTFIACPDNRYENKTIVGFTSKSKIKRKSDGKYLVISGPKLLKYYADRANAEDYEFQKVYDVGTATNLSASLGYADTGPVVTDIDNRTSKHQLCFGGDSDHVSYTGNADEATIFSIKEDDNNLTIKVEFEVTNFNITQGTTQIGSYQSPHTITKYIELLGNGDLSLCNKINHSLYTSTKGFSNARGMDWYTSDGWYTWTSFYTTTQYANGKITGLHNSNGQCCQCTVYKPNSEWCFYGPSDQITNSYPSFKQRYELDHIEKDDFTRVQEIDTTPNCIDDKTPTACQMDYKKCTSYEEFFPYHGNKTDYSFGKCVPKTSFLNKLSTDKEIGDNKWSSELADIVTKRCDQSLDCKSGVKSSNVFNKDDMDKQFDYLIGLIPSGVHPAVIQNKRNRANLIIENDMKPITYSDACTSKTE